MMTIEYSQYKKFRPIHIFEYYDFPLFYLLASTKGEIYLNYYVDYLPTGKHKWMFAKITKYEKNNLIEQRLSVLTLLNELKDKNRLYYLYDNKEEKNQNEKLNTELINSNNFDEEGFPEEDFYVEYDYLTNEKFVEVKNLLIDSSKFNLVLEDKQSSHSIDLTFLTSILNNFEETLNDFAKTIGLKMMKGYESDIKLQVNALQPSSFGISLNSTEDLFGIPEKALSNLFKILNEVKDNKIQEIEEQLEIDEIYSIESIKTLYKLLNSLLKNEYSLNLEGKTLAESSKKNVKFDKASYDKINILKDILNKKNKITQEEIKINGTLSSINLNRNNFRIDDIDEYISNDNTVEFISGKMSEDLFKSSKKDLKKRFIVPSKIGAVIIKETEINHIKDVNKLNYILKEYKLI